MPEKETQIDVGYDTLDAFVDGLLRVEIVPEETKEREPDMVSLQPTPVRVILELIEKANITKDDIFYDVGSGLGQVAILVGLLAEAKVKGIEFEPAYCEYAQRCATGLNLSHVEFINADARDADYSDGTIFFMYTPFRGSMLQHVLERLRSESRKRAIRIGTYGPCTPRVSAQGWLRCIGQPPEHEYELAVFRSIE
jgi:SAM-dependent methyltransferase